MALWVVFLKAIKMSRELALLLAQENHVQRWQLENALQAQLMYDLPLVLSLVKLGYIEEEKLLQIGSKFYDIPLLSPEKWNNIPHDVIDLLPRDFMREWRVFPIEKAAGTLLLAVSRLPDDDLVEEISLFLGMKIKFALCHEAIMIESARYYYALPLPSLIKYDRSIKKFKPPENDLSSNEITFKDEAEDLLIDMDDAEEDIELKLDLDDKVLNTMLGLGDDISESSETEIVFAKKISGSEITSDEESLSSGTIVDSDANTESGSILLDMDDAVDEVEAETEAETAEPDRIDESEDLQFATIDIDGFQDELSDTESRDELIAIVSKWLAKYYKSSCFLTVKKSQAAGFYTTDGNIETSEFKKFEISLNLDSACKVSREKMEVVLVDEIGDASIDPLYSFFELDLPTSAIVVPASMKGRCIGLFVGLQLKDQQIAEAQWEQFRLSLSSAFETLILSKKIGV